MNARETPPSDTHEVPPQLADSLARIDQARENYVSLVHELNVFLYEYVKGMVKGYDRETEGFVLQLRHPRENNVSGRPVVLISQIVENLRAALDYLVYQFSVFNQPKLNERVPQFVIADNESSFYKQAKSRLRYLTHEQKDFVEQIQPYHGNKMLSLLGTLSVQGKHRHLLSLRDMSGWRIVGDEVVNQGKYEGYYVYPMGRGHATFAKPMDKPVFLLIEKYDAVPSLSDMIRHVEDILRVFYGFFQGRPPKLTVLMADKN